MSHDRALTEIPVPAGGLMDLFIVIVLSGLLFLTSISQAQTIIRAEATLLLTVYFVYMGSRVLL